MCFNNRMKNTYHVRAKVVLWPGAVAAWHFVTLPAKQSADIKKRFGGKARGWGSLPVVVTLGKTKWRTSIFWDNRSGAYILPLKLAVRRAEGVAHGDMVTFLLEVRV